MHLAFRGFSKKIISIISLFWELNFIVDMLNLFRKYLPLPVMDSLSKMNFLIWLKKSVTYKRYFREHIKCKQINS